MPHYWKNPEDWSGQDALGNAVPTKQINTLPEGSVYQPCANLSEEYIKVHFTKVFAFQKPPDPVPPLAARDQNFGIPQITQHRQSRNGTIESQKRNQEEQSRGAEQGSWLCNAMRYLRYIRIIGVVIKLPCR